MAGEFSLCEMPTVASDVGSLDKQNADSYNGVFILLGIDLPVTD